MKRLVGAIGYATAGVLAAVLVAFLLLWLTEWRPRATEPLPVADPPGQLPDTIRILSWNTGYAGLGDDMDFFMDGGTRTRTSAGRTADNLDSIAALLASCGADILLLQEVDRDSRRSYRTDQLEAYRRALPGYRGWFALNYHAPLVPVPLRSPLGRVSSGVAIFSRIEPTQVVRNQYESRFAFPVRLFNLKRCWLAAEFRSAQGTPVWIGVTHNTAYDTGKLRAVEMEQLYGWFSDRGPAIVGGDWNQNPTGYTPTAAETHDPHFSPRPIPENPDLQAVFDARTPTVRYLYEPLGEGTTRSVIDFFLVSPGVQCAGVETIDLGFRHSDHNPVVATLVISAEP